MIPLARGEVKDGSEPRSQAPGDQQPSIWHQGDKRRLPRRRI